VHSSIFETYDLDEILPAARTCETWSRLAANAVMANLYLSDGEGVTQTAVYHSRLPHCSVLGKQTI